MNKNCVFCKLDKLQRIFKIGKYSIVIFSNPRVAKGHLLVIPKRHIEKLSELSSKEVIEIHRFLSEIQEKLLKHFGTGSEVRQNYKPYLPDSRTHVNHLHFHIIPRNRDDEIAQKVDKHRKPLYKDLPAEEMDQVVNLLGQ